MQQEIESFYDPDQIIELYQKYALDLKRVKAQQRAFYLSQGYLPLGHQPTSTERVRARLIRFKNQITRFAHFRPQLDDIESEITYLLLRELQPESVVEISPSRGWSTTWILSALRDNQKGQLQSYDIVNYSKRFVPKSLAKGRWQLFVGDVKEKIDTFPKKIDYLFIDSDHSAEFAHWYIETVFPLLESGTPVSVHDVYHDEKPDAFDGEGKVVVDWLNRHRIPCLTFSPKKSPQLYEKTEKAKASLEINKPIHTSNYNSMIFFPFMK